MLYKGDVAIKLKKEIDDKAFEKPFIIKNLGYYKEQKSSFKLTFDNNNYVLLYLHKGIATVTINKKKHIITAGTTVVFKKFDNNSIFYHDDDNNERYYIYFDGYNVEKLLKEFSLDSENIYTTGERFDFIENTLLILNKFKAERDFSSIFCSSLFLSLLAKTSPLSRIKDNILQNNSSIKNALNHMAQNLNKPVLTLEEYAKICCISKITLIKTFKKITGVSPVKYFTMLKIDNAQLQLTNTSKSIEEIANSLGYVDPLYFSRIFKKHVGQSPLNFRKNKT